MKTKAFSLVEIILVVTILGILGAIVFPEFQDHVTKARETAAKDNLRAMRTQIELYKIQHKGSSPGYVNGNPVPEGTMQIQLTGISTETGQAQASTVPSDPYLNGPYVKKLPENPFNKLSNIKYVLEATAFSDAVDGTSSGWLYKKETAEIRINWTGTDSEGVNFYDY